MIKSGRSDNPVDADDLTDLPGDLLNSIAKTPDNEFGDETQANEERTAGEGLEQSALLDPRGEDEPEQD
ncbi:MAG: hypothetical protein ABIQ70_13950 [Dokdonella sp.]